MTRPAAPGGLTRRAALGGGLAALVLPALLVGARRLGFPEVAPGRLGALRAVLDTLPAEAAAVGREAWRDQPWWRDRVDVAADLLEGWDGADLAPWLVARRAADHAEGRVRAVDGWLLSHTELRLLLLAHHPVG